MARQRTMAIFYEVMLEELERNLRKQEAFKNELALHPKGYLSICVIGGVPYVYRKWREGSSIRSEYVGVPGDDSVKAAEEDRKAYLFAKSSLAELRKEEKSIRRSIKNYGGV